MIINEPALHAEVSAAFAAYEAALMADDLAVMDALFHDSATTCRFGVGERLWGIEEIRDFRKGRGGSPPRRLGRVMITVFGANAATTMAEFFREGSERAGRQSQTWIKFADGWKIVAAHVSLEGAGH